MDDLKTKRPDREVGASSLDGPGLSDGDAQKVLETRIANALFGDARISQKALAALSVVSRQGGPGAALGMASIQPTLDAFARFYGGLWVGGRVTLSERVLTFEPNAINRAIHENGDSLRLDLPLRQIDMVRTRFGFISGIVDIVTDERIFSLRCFGAKRFAARIDAARRALIVR